MNPQIKKRFNDIIGFNIFHRVDAKHTLDIYIGKDQAARCTLFLVSNTNVPKIYSSKIISVMIGIRRDKQYGISFTLIDDAYEDIFCDFCGDIIESSRYIKDKKFGVSFICSRYNMWQKMLKKNNDGVLTPAEIKGLIGELHFLMNFMMNKHGIDTAVSSWMGPDMADQDFICEDFWYEIKTTTSGNECVQISSIEQLDIVKNGELVIIYLDKTSSTDSESITLNSIVDNIMMMITTDATKQKFSDLLLLRGYYERSEYDDYRFKFVHMERYTVDQNFPALRRNKIPVELINAKYELSIASLVRFKKEV